MAERPPSSTRPAPAGDRSRRGGRCLEHGEDYSREGGSHPEHRQHGVVEDAAGAADPDLLRATLASGAHLGGVVPAAAQLLFLDALEAHAAVLAPVSPPRIFYLPVLDLANLDVHGLPVAVQHDRVADHVLAVATIRRQDAVEIPVPVRARGYGDGNRPVVDEAVNELCLLVRWKFGPPQQPGPAAHHEARVAAPVDHVLLRAVGHEHGLRADARASEGAPGPLVLGAGGLLPCLVRGELRLADDLGLQRVLESQLRGGPLAAAGAAALVGVGGAG
mmetsp:Transcript_10778/g.30028  ORF Transcript_10778/g.30028 Transcript_10778/m.30028 type:complete len:276 (+) Transcript_10778:103-930(+)